MEPYSSLSLGQRTVLLSHVAQEYNSCKDVILGAFGWSWKSRIEGRGSRLVGAQAQGTGCVGDHLHPPKKRKDRSYLVAHN